MAWNCQAGCISSVITTTRVAAPYLLLEKNTYKYGFRQALEETLF